MPASDVDSRRWEEKSEEDSRARGTPDGSSIVISVMPFMMLMPFFMMFMFFVFVMFVVAVVPTLAAPLEAEADGWRSIIIRSVC